MTCARWPTLGPEAPLTGGWAFTEGAAGAFLATEANFRQTDGYRGLWMLKTALDEGTSEGKERTAAEAMKALRAVQSPAESGT